MVAVYAFEYDATHEMVDNALGCIVGMQLLNFQQYLMPQPKVKGANNAGKAIW